MARTVSSQITATWTNQSFVVVGGQPVYQAPNTGTAVLKSFLSNRSDVVKTPGFSRQMNAYGYVPPLPYTWDIRSEAWTNGSMIRWTGSTSGYRRMGAIGTFLIGAGAYSSDFLLGSILLPSWSKTDALCTNKVLGKAKAQKVNLLQAFAERAQTARLLVTSVTGIARLLEAVHNREWLYLGEVTGLSRRQIINRSRAFRRVRRKRGLPIDRVSEQWLAVQYGWRPLVSDIYGVCDELTTREYNPALPWLTVKAGIPWKGSSPDVTVHKQTGTYNQGAKRVVTIEDTVGTFMRLDYKIPRPDREALKALGLTNPLTIAWELLPWSFVIDWMLPIGNWINTFDATVGLTFVSGSKTQWLERKVTHQYSANNKPSAGYWFEVADANYVGTQSYGKRTVLSSSPLPKPPQWKNPASFTHLANALALLTGLTRGKSIVR